MFMLPLFAFPQEVAEPTTFLPSIFPLSEIPSFWWTVTTIIPFGTQKVLLTPVAKKYAIGSFPLTSSMTLTYLLFSIAPPLTSSLLPPLLLLGGAQDLGSDYLPTVQTVPLSPVFRSNECLPSFNFHLARLDNFAFYFDPHCPAEEYSSLSSAVALFTSLILNALLTI